MKQKLLTSLLLLLSIVAPFAAVAADSFSVKAIYVEQGGTATLQFNLQNTSTFYGFQAEVTLPDGLTPEKAADGNYITLADRTKDGNYSVNSNLVNGTIIMGAFSLKNPHSAITGNDGVLAEMKVAVAKDFAGGTVKVSNIMFIDKDDQDVKLDATSTEIGVAVKEISFKRTTLSLTVGDEAVKLTPYISPSEASDQSVTWKSSDPSVATVSDQGSVLAVKAGTAEITATSSNGLTATCTVTVKAKVIEVESISLSKEVLDLTAGDEETLVATITPEDATDSEVEWSSDNEEVAKVSQEGVVTALKKGTATITASTHNGKEASCTVNVAAKIIEVTEVKLSKTSVELKVGKTETLTATVLPEDADDHTVSWKSSDEKIATVATVNGKVTITANAIGDANIIATCGSVEGICAVKVVPTPVDSITFTRKKLSLDVDSKPVTLTPNFFPYNPTDQTVTWKSSDESVVTVSASGEVIPVSEGTANVTATTSNGKVATCVVTVTAETVDVESITLDNEVLNLTAGETVTLIATVTPENATDASVEWESKDGSIATVSDKGVVTAKSSGSTIITATSSNGLEATCVVNVTVPVTEVKLSKTSVELKVGNTETLTATVLPEDATDHTVTWKSSDETIATVATVNNKVTITAKAIGNANIIATCGSVEGICAVKVVATPVDSVYFTRKTLGLKEGEKTTLKPNFNPSSATDKTVTWKSSNTTVATVSESGEVVAVKAGTADITATSTNGKVATCKVTVTAVTIAVESVTISNATLDLTVGDIATLTASVNPINATDQEVDWTSSDSKVVTVSANGEVKAIKAGTATITVSTHNGKSATCTVTVVAKTIEVSEVTLNKNSETILLGETLELVATVTPTNATDANVTWTSSDPDIAYVDEKGVVTALTVGKATITAKAGGKTAECVVTVTKTTGVELIGIDLEAPMTVYDLNGRQVSDKVEGLAKGIYIIRQGDNVKKVIIR